MLVARLRGCAYKSQNLHTTTCSSRSLLLQNRPWLLHSPETQVKRVVLPGSTASFTLLQDDLLHPVLGGNKLRKMDALIPHLRAASITDVVTCGGVQSAHTAAVAAACAEVGITAHLLVRGNKPEIPTGYHLLARMYGHVTYISRSDYSNRQLMFDEFLERLQSNSPHAKIRKIPEGGAEPLALLGLVRLIEWLASSTTLPASEPCCLVVDSGTGATAVGLALGIRILQLPWYVVAVTLAGVEQEYMREAARLSADFLEQFRQHFPTGTLWDAALPLQWVQRLRPRKFGRVFPEELEACSQIAKRTGVLLDPIYSLAAWEVAEKLADGCSVAGLLPPSRVAMLHCGGALGLHGLAQRFPDSF